MNLLNILGFGASKKKEENRRIDSILEFQAVLHRETARANRRNAKLSLILIEKSEKVLDYLGTIAYSRLRLSDEIGWHTSDKLGILLPDTATDGARNLIENLNEECSRIKHTRINYKICTYPSPDWPVNI